MKRKCPEHGSPRGFTLIELLIVIAIIGMLASLIVAGIGAVRQSAKKAEARTDIDAISAGLKSYELDHGILPGWNVDPDPETNSFPDLYESLCGDRPPEGKMPAAQRGGQGRRVGDPASHVDGLPAELRSSPLGVREIKLFSQAGQQPGAKCAVPRSQGAEGLLEQADQGFVDGAHHRSACSIAQGGAG